jgi:hypothetical protein
MTITLLQVCSQSCQNQTVGTQTSRHWCGYSKESIGRDSGWYKRSSTQRDIRIYCGEETTTWSKLKKRGRDLRSHSEELSRCFPVGFVKGTRQRLSYAGILCRRGPSSIEVLRPLRNKEVGSLLEVLHACRSKLASDPKDKVFGIYGILTDEIRYHFNPDYGKLLREIYTDVVDYLLHTTRSLDVICHAIHFPPYTSTTGNLPTWVPEWSHVQHTSSLSSSYKFSAAENTKASFTFLGEQRTKMEISAIYLDIVVRAIFTKDKYISRIFSEKIGSYNMSI